mgnify:CR=1 FL=1
MLDKLIEYVLYDVEYVLYDVEYTNSSSVGELVGKLSVTLLGILVGILVGIPVGILEGKVVGGSKLEIISKDNGMFDNILYAIEYWGTTNTFSVGEVVGIPVGKLEYMSKDPGLPDNVL